MEPLHISLAALAGILLAFYGIAVLRTMTWEPGTEKPALKGLALPEGSVRSLIALLVVGAFVSFLFFGKDALTTTETMTVMNANGETVETLTKDTALFNTVVAALGTLAGSVVGFYFGGRTAQGPK